MLSWHQLVSPSVLQKLSLSGLLNRYIVIGLASSHINREALHKCQAVSIKILPIIITHLNGYFLEPKVDIDQTFILFLVNL